MHICNPMNLSYPYQFHGKFYGNAICREGADPSMVLFKGRYFLFASMSGGFWVSDDLVSWEYHTTPELPIHDYAPDVRVVGDWLYISASRRLSKCPFYRTKDPLSGKFEKVAATMTFWDPHLFADDDGKLYFYWGCSNKTPLYGVELDPETMKPKHKPVGLITEQTHIHGFERNGENHIMLPPKNLPDKLFRALAGGDAPYVEGAWMNKHKGKYYLQYAVNGTEFNAYSDGVYVSDSPLGPYTFAKNNPYSYRPGGFMPGAGHGSTMEDKYGNYWHAASMRISMNHTFERRVGMFPAGFDADGELFCNQRYGDWPMKMEQGKMDPWQEPEWMLLSCGKAMTASSCAEDDPASLAAEECEQTWWKAAYSKPGQWLQVDLGEAMDVRGIQINFADDALKLPLPENASWGGEWPIKRIIDTRSHYTRWLLEGSQDGETYFVICDKREAQTDLSHDFVCLEDGIQARYLRCTVTELPFNQTPAISALRVFGRSHGEKPVPAANVTATLTGELDADVSWNADSSAVGHAILWGYAPDKLYHSIMVYGKNNCHIAALIAGQECYLRIDSFNEAGITHGEIQKIK